ncbi:MAG TPA: hypothetical protein VFG49_01270 [Dyella sp.]|uniref:hypothetical protein n=1 Tax=Dyella sp. TaxID=1869338 RepID=UPI002D79BC9F|nr:hypothetical protein [Dyella sp.]HET6552141.1 hypothetical protein [Dyella sp.]
MSIPCFVVSLNNAHSICLIRVDSGPLKAEEESCPHQAKAATREVTLTTRGEGSLAAERTPPDQDSKHQAKGQQLVRGDHRRILGQRHRRLDGSHALGHDLGGAHVVSTEEGLKRGLTCPMRLPERGPAQQEVTEHHRVVLLKPA